CAPPTTGAASAPASEVSRKRRRSMPGWWGDSTVEVKYVAVVSTAGDPRSALAADPDHRPIDAGVQSAAAAVINVEGVQLGQEAHHRGAYRRASASARAAGPAPSS